MRRWAWGQILLISSSERLYLRCGNRNDAYHGSHLFDLSDWTESISCKFLSMAGPLSTVPM
jgi:hypothetical protein